MVIILRIIRPQLNLRSWVAETHYGQQGELTAKEHSEFSLAERYESKLEEELDHANANIHIGCYGKV